MKLKGRVEEEKYFPEAQSYKVQKFCFCNQPLHNFPA